MTTPDAVHARLVSLLRGEGVDFRLTQHDAVTTSADAAAVRGESPRSVWRRAPLIRDLLRGFEETQHGGADAPPLLRGEDVMERFGLPPSPAVGRLLERAREAQALGLVATREEALAYLDSPPGGP